MSDFKDPTQVALEKARERGLLVTDEASGVAPHNPEPFRSQQGRVPLAYNTNPRLQRENAFQYQPLSDPTNQSLHASLPPDKQAELAEKMLLQQIEQNSKRFEQEMQKEDHKVKRSRMLIMTGVKIFKWLFIVFVAAFAGLVIVLGVTGWKAGSLSDTSIINAIVSFFTSILSALITNSSL